MGGSEGKAMLKYTCATCGDSCESDITEEEAKAEMKALWGDIPEDQQVIICDDCFKEGMARMASESGDAKSEQDGVITRMDGSPVDQSEIAKVREIINTRGIEFAPGTEAEMEKIGITKDDVTAMLLKSMGGVH